MCGTDFASAEIIAKGPGNYVTAIDLEVQNRVIEGLLTFAPDSVFLAEENKENDRNIRAAADTRPCWILDPVDGTNNLMRGMDHSSISLALAEGGRLRAGWVYNPYRDELYSAIAGAGSTLNGRPVRAGDRGDLADCLIGFGTTPYNRATTRQTFAILETFYAQSLDIRRTGSAAIDLAYVADGRLDGFFEWRLEAWDYAAGTVLVEAAGGRVTRLDGSPIRWDEGGSVLAGSAAIHSRLLEVVRTSGVLPPTGI